MIVETYTCDKCKELMVDSSYGMYVISHDTIGDNSMWGDNRVKGEIHFCKKCFDLYLAPVIKE